MMKRIIVYVLTFFITLTLSYEVLAQSATARVGDFTRLQGQGDNILIAYGLVTGLDGTGDGEEFLPTIRSLHSALKNMDVPIGSIEEITSSANTALVMVEAVIPSTGAREGDRIDVSVTTIGTSDSLKGGRLFPTPLFYEDRSYEPAEGEPEHFAFARGAIRVSEDIMTSGVIKQGARMERDVFMNVVARGSTLLSDGIRNPWIQPNNHYVTLVLDEAHAGWTMAAAVAQAVDKELGISADVEQVALAVDQKNVVVLLPEHQIQDPASWIRDIERIPLLMESNEAKVVINRRTGTIIVTGDTRVSPVVVSQKGLTITVATAPAEDGVIPQPAFEQMQFIPVDIEAAREPNVRDLLEALNRLKVPFEDRVAILEEIHRAGKLHATMHFEG